MLGSFHLIPVCPRAERCGACSRKKAILFSNLIEAGADCSDKSCLIGSRWIMALCKDCERDFDLDIDGVGLQRWRIPASLQLESAA